MYPRTLLLIILLWLGFLGPASAQRLPARFWDVFRTHMEFGVQGGMSGYVGEINPDVYRFNSWSLGGGAKYYFDRIDERDRTWGLRLDYQFTDLNAADRDSKNAASEVRNFEFSNRLHELSAMAEFHFLKFRPLRSRALYSPYVFAGVGVIRHNPKAPHPNSGHGMSLIDAMVDPRRDGKGNVEKRSKYAMIIPFGAGFKYNLSRIWTPVSIGVELSYRYAHTDFLDGATKNDYIDFTEVKDKIRPSMSAADWEDLAGPHTSLAYQELVDGSYKRGNPGNDFFMTATFRITYTLYKWRDPLWK